MCSPTWKHISLGICVGGRDKSRDMCFPGRGTHITKDMCFPSGGTHITRDILGQNHRLTPLEKCQFFDFLNFLFL